MFFEQPGKVRRIENADARGDFADRGIGLAEQVFCLHNDGLFDPRQRGAARMLFDDAVEVCGAYVEFFGVDTDRIAPAEVVENQIDEAVAEGVFPTCAPFGRKGVLVGGIHFGQQGNHIGTDDLPIPVSRILGSEPFEEVGDVYGGLRVE